MVELDSFPASTEPHVLSTPQLRVLRVLGAAKGPLSRSEISRRCGNKTVVVVGRAVGYSDPAKRLQFEQTKDGGGTPGQPYPSLLTLVYVVEKELDVDGLKETVLELTLAGREALEEAKTIELPPLRLGPGSKED